jgi:3-deoxy-D-manno-octulosonate 8-phosphate phosphatase (KDO 8-P phosphatase)
MAKGIVIGIVIMGGLAKTLLTMVYQSQTKLSRDQLGERLKSVKLLSLDVDGVLTDGGLYYTDEGLAFRKFNVRDGLGIVLVREAGLEVAIISAGRPASTVTRAKDLGIEHVRVGVSDKLKELSEICETLDIHLNDVAHIGDDLPDLGLMQAVGVPITVADGADAVKKIAAYVTERDGGQGAVREICDLLLESQARLGD